MHPRSLVALGDMSALISAADLDADRYGGHVRIIDVQYQLGGPPSEQLYAACHIPEAPHLSLDDALAGPPGARGRHPLPDPGVLEEALRACGIDDGDAIVVYDQASSLAAARAWWVLRWAGLTDVRVLDGGLAAWQRAGLPTSSQPAHPPAGVVSVRPGSIPHLSLEDAAEWAHEGRLLDVRTAERYRGEIEPIDPVAGHIPGALNLPMALTQHDDGTFRSGAEIRRLAVAAGVHDGQPVGTSCGSGVTAAQMALALGEAGIEAIPYIGSWSEWVADPARPVATGA